MSGILFFSREACIPVNVPVPVSKEVCEDVPKQRCAKVEKQIPKQIPTKKCGSYSHGHGSHGHGSEGYGHGSHDHGSHGYGHGYTIGYGAGYETGYGHGYGHGSGGQPKEIHPEPKELNLKVLISAKAETN